MQVIIRERYYGSRATNERRVKASSTEREELFIDQVRIELDGGPSVVVTEKGVTVLKDGLPVSWYELKEGTSGG